MVPAVVPSAIVTIAVAGALIILAMILRERHHRRRRDALETQLADLEGVLVGLAVPSKDQSPAVAAAPDASCFSDDSFSPRGPLSTAISILQNDLGLNLPGADRTDLRALGYLDPGR